MSDVIQELTLLSQDACNLAQTNQFATQFLSIFTNSEFDRYDFFCYIIENNKLEIGLKWLSLVTLRHFVTENWYNLSDELSESIIRIVTKQIINWSHLIVDNHPFLLILDSIFVQIIEFEICHKWNDIPIIHPEPVTIESYQNTFRIFSLIAEDLLYHNHLFTSQKCLLLKTKLLQISDWLMNIYLNLPDEKHKSCISAKIEAMNCFRIFIQLDPLFYSNNSINFFNNILQNLPIFEFQVSIFRILESIINSNLLNQDCLSNNPSKDNSIKDIYNLFRTVFSSLPKHFHPIDLTLNNREFFALFTTVSTKFAIIFLPYLNEGVEIVISWILDMMSFKDDDIFFSCCTFILHISKIMRNCVRNEFDFLKKYSENIIQILIQKIPCPFDIIVIKKDDKIEINEEKMNNKDLFEIISKILQNFTKFDFQTVRKVIFNMSNDIKTKYDLFYLNNCCWSSGVITPVLSEIDEIDFTSQIIFNILKIFELSDSTSDNILISYCLFFFVPQCPRLLMKYPEYGETLLSKLFEYLNDQDKIVRQMTVVSIHLLATKCRDFLLLKNHIELFFSNIMNHIETSRIHRNFSYDSTILLFSAISFVIGNDCKDSIKVNHLARIQILLQNFKEYPLLFLQIVYSIQKNIQVDFSNIFESIFSFILFQMSLKTQIVSEKEKILKISCKIILNYIEFIRNEVQIANVFVQILKLFISSPCPIIKEMFCLLKLISKNYPSIICKQWQKIMNTLIYPALNLFSEYQQPKFNIFFLEFLSEFIKNCMNSINNDEIMQVLFKLIILNCCHILPLISQLGFALLLQFYEKFGHDDEMFRKYLQFEIFSSTCLCFMNQFKESYLWSDDSSIIDFFVYFIKTPNISPNFIQQFDEKKQKMIDEMVNCLEDKEQLYLKIRDFRVTIRYTK
ncbi:hypothetical protein TRFO_35195 [Tritrichomonas foetus]|uniref:Importin N-terminal domain-containing protein n=1 Tax=Tritrichomonas foetus TaxID=1144522 RepID=A0A1J4JGY4_9EUKA|nr:hypothetical protein TRFO_35195 [Tritrichomonas foetus]|eukprot:OHS98418.1 hypothetical protein TRFO_35195 [Tritrichomonas foetus]